MKKFLILYKSETSAQEMMTSATPEQMQASMNEWIQWKEQVGKDQFEWGLPLGSGMEITTDQALPIDNKIGGYSIISGDSLQEVAELLKSHPHLKQEGNKIKLLEMIPMPGM